MAWLGFPHVVSAGAQKNFAKYAERIGKEWEASDTAFNEEFFRDAISRAIIFRSTEALVSKQSWYQAGNRANMLPIRLRNLPMTSTREANHSTSVRFGHRNRFRRFS